MARPVIELADIMREYGDLFLQKYGSICSPGQLKVMESIVKCRTAALGGHIQKCDTCAHEVPAYNSCCNRHCPKCGSVAKARWLQARRRELLPLDYFHVVFTLPRQFENIALQNKRTVFNLLFKAVAKTLMTIAADPKHLGAEIGYMAVLHTWGQNLMNHPHVHCVVPGGGISADGLKWISCRKCFFLPVRVLSRLFRRLFLEGLEEAFCQKKLEFHGSIEDLSDQDLFEKLLDDCRMKEWVVYAKPPFAGPDKVLDYLSRYTHRVAISNHRLISMAARKVTFTIKDYKDAGKKKTMTLDVCEFIRRFLLHVLPKGFMRIRYYGFMANRHRVKEIRLCRKLLGQSEEDEDKTDEKIDWTSLLEILIGAHPLKCPVCRRGQLVIIRTIPNSTGRHNKSPPPRDSQCRTT